MTAEVMNQLATIFEVALRIVLAVVVTGGIVIVFGAWMQDNPTLRKRREQQNRTAMKKRIQQELIIQKNS